MNKNIAQQVIEPNDRLRRGSFIVDELSRVESAISELEKQRRILRAAMEREHGVGYFAGQEFKLRMTKTRLLQLDASRIRDEMGIAWCRRHGRVDVITTVTAEPLTAGDMLELKDERQNP